MCSRYINSVMLLSPGHHNRTFLWLLCAYGANGRGQTCVDTATPCELNRKLVMLVIHSTWYKYLLHLLHCLRMHFRIHDTKWLVQCFRNLERRQSQAPTGISIQMSFPVNSTPRQRPSSSTPLTILLGRSVSISHLSLSLRNVNTCWLNVTEDANAFSGSCRLPAGFHQRRAADDRRPLHQTRHSVLQWRGLWVAHL